MGPKPKAQASQVSHSCMLVEESPDKGIDVADQIVRRDTCACSYCKANKTHGISSPIELNMAQEYIQVQPSHIALTLHHITTPDRAIHLRSRVLVDSLDYPSYITFLHS